MDVLRGFRRKVENKPPPQQDVVLSLLTIATYIALALVLIATCVVPLSGRDDVWSHIAVGRWIIEHRTVPRHNLFTWHHQDYPWVAHSWLSQVFFCGLWRIGGTVAIILFRLAAIAMCLLILYSLWRKAKAPLTFFPGFAFLTVSAASLRFSTRPELFTFIALATEIKWLLEFKFCGSKSLRFLPLLFIAWVNLHGAFVLGVLLLVLFALGEWFQSNCVGHDVLKTSYNVQGNRLRLLFAITLLSLLATFCSPYGFKVYRALEPEWMTALRSYIVEWQSLLMLYQQGQLPWEAVVPAAALLCWAFYLAFRSAQGVHVSLLLWLLCLSALAWSASRQLGALAIACLAIAGAVKPPVASSKQEHTAPQKKRLPYETHGFAGVMLCLVLLTFARIIADGKTIGRRYGFGIDVETTPVGAARFVRDNHLGQRLYNPPNYAYLDWHFGANHRLFYDIQADYPPATLSEAMASLQANLNPREYVRRWDFDVVLCPLTGTPSPLIPYLSRNPRWAVIYWDGTDVVFVRRLPRYAHFIRKHAYRYIKPFLSFAAVLAEREDAMAEIERALETAPKTFALYRLAASLYWSFGEDDKAQEMIQQAMKMHPNELQARELKSIFGCPR